MREITSRDLLALLTPLVVTVLTAFFVVRERGWIAGAIAAGAMLVLGLGIWAARIRKYPEDTWKPRI